MPAAPPAAPPPRPQGWLQSERIGSAPLRSARFGPVRPGSIRRDGTAPPRPVGPTAAAKPGVLRPCPNGTGGGRALPPPCPEPRPLITANYSPEAAAAPPCRGPGHPRARSRPWLCHRALRPRRDRAEPGQSTGPARGGSQLQWAVRSHAVCRPHAVTTAHSSSRCKGAAQGRAVGGGLCGVRAWEVRAVWVGGATPGVGLEVDNVETEGHPPIVPSVPEGSRVLSKGDESSPAMRPCPLVLGEDDAPSTRRFSKPWPQ